ncbi:MAG: translocation/assembly module TamB domain-containing protein [Pseudomonadota bacterium]|nr:translocation/assembly module TamB domain-containing protein [Pseudomonadota bacterium]
MTDHQPSQETPEAPEPGRRSRWFWVLVGLGVLVLLPVLLLVLILLALKSETGTAWVIDQVPGLQVTDGRGSLLDQWQAADLVWQGYGADVRVQAPVIAWSPSCLFSKQVCLDTLKADTIDVSVEPSAEPDESESPLALPDVDIPMGLRIGEVDLGPFTFNQNRIWDRLELSAGGSGAEWRIDRAQYRLDDYVLGLAGRIETRRDWPLALELTASLPPPAGDRWSLDLDLSGSVRDLRLSGRSQGYLEAGLQGQVSPLDERLPAQLRIDSKEFLALADLPATLTLKDWFLEARGSLAEGFRTRGRATLPGTEGGINLSLDGQVGTEAARDLELQLRTQDGDNPGQLRVTGAVKWLDGLQANANLQLDRFPWYSLLPDLEPPPVRLNRLDGSVTWADGQYHAKLQADVEGPQGQASLSSTVDGDLTETRLSDLMVTTGAGALSGDGKVNFAGPLTWQAALRLEDFNPGYWVPALEASLSGDISTEGQLREGRLPAVKAQWQLAGQWQQQPAEASGALDSSSGSWQLSDLAVLVGDNRIEGSGAWGEELAGKLRLDLPAPEQLLAGLAGQVQAEVSVAGTLDNPTGDVSLWARDLAWQDTLELGALEVDAALKPGWRLSSRIDASAIESAGQQLESLSLTGSGTREQHRVEILAEHAEAAVALVFAGGFQGAAWDAWQGALAQGRIEVPQQNQRWDLQAPASLAYQHSPGKLTFGAHCWQWQQSSVCADDQVLLPTPSIAYRIRNVPTSALDPLMPERLRWLGSLNGDIDVTMADGGPRGKIRVDAGSGQFEVQVEGDDWETLAYDRFTLALGLQPEQADLELRLAGPSLGELAVDVGVDPRSSERRIQGQFSLERLDIALAGIFAGLDEVAGQIQGRGTLSGPLLKPAVEGELSLTGGRIVDPRLPIPMEEVVATLTLNGYAADLSGRIQSSERGQTRLDGRVSWEGEPEGEIEIQGERVPFSLEPYAQLELAPDLVVAFGQGDLKVTGQLAVPRGSIEIKGLPPQAISVTEDEVIVGVEPEQPVIRSINMDVTVVVGEDEVSFVAFGVTGNLEGTLRIGNDMDTRGTLQLVDGQYEKFGQELELRTARILFVGNLTQPYLEIEAIRRVDTVVAGIRLSGPVQAPETEIFSSPDMPQTDALSYLVLGRPPQSQGDQGQMSGAAISLGLTQANKVTGKLGEEIGIQQLMLETEGSGEQTSVVASGYLTDELSVRYGVGVFEPITTVALRYDLTRNIYVEAASGLAASLDIFYTRDF